jgi:Arm DNA-binding domain
MKITKQAVDKLTTGIMWDDELKGFGVRCRGEGKHYVLQYRVGSRQRWVTIGRHGSPWTPDTARREAKRLLGEVAARKDPALTRDHDKGAVTVKQLCDRFTEGYLPPHVLCLPDGHDKEEAA